MHYSDNCTREVSSAVPDGRAVADNRGFPVQLPIRPSVETALAGASSPEGEDVRDRFPAKARAKPVHSVAGRKTGSTTSGSSTVGKNAT